MVASCNAATPGIFGEAENVDDAEHMPLMRFALAFALGLMLRA